MRPASPLLFPGPLPVRRRGIDGWAVGDRVMFPDPRSPGLERPGRVIAMLPGPNLLVLRAERPAAIVDIAPQRCRKIT